MNQIFVPDSLRRWDCLSLGEVMLRLDPGESRIHTTRNFTVWEGGGEYNVARGLRRCFGLRTAIASVIAENPLGCLVEDLILQGGVDTSLFRWIPYDGVGRSVRNGLNFTERGSGVRAAVGFSDRGHTAISQVKPGDFDWDAIFGENNGSRWFHTGGIFAALSGSTAAVAAEAMDAARRDGTPVSYDLNFRDSLWKSIGGKVKAQEVNRELVRKLDVLLGNEEDFSAMLGVAIKGVGEDFAALPLTAYEEMLREVAANLPQPEAHRQHFAHCAHSQPQRVGCDCSVSGPDFACRPTRRRHLRPRRGRRQLCLGPDLRLSCRPACGVGHALRSCPRCTRYDYSRRHQHGHSCRGRARHQRWLDPHCAIKDLCPRPRR